MPVIRSLFEVGRPQADGRRYVTERHTLDTGEVITREYGPVPEMDYAAVMAAKAARIEQALADAEFEGIIGGA